VNKLAVSTVVFALATCVAANATIISGDLTGGSAKTNGGTFIKLSVPLNNPLGPANSVGSDNFNTSNLYGFDEDQNITLLADLVVDQGTSPIPAGTVVASHYIFFDPLQTEEAIGTVNFDAQVIGILTTTADLAASDFLANTGVNYLNPSNRGLEAGDSVTISGPNSILFNTFASSPGDYVRVLTLFSPNAGTPEPGTIALFGGGLAALALLRKRRKQA
jgi:PEP-CTERM motif